MRVKSEAKRQAILNAAAEAFREFGVEGTSMSEIATRVGGSKATLYAYFSSKEELVLEILLATGERHGEASFAALTAAPDIRSGLKHFGVELLRFITNPNTIAITRLAITEGGRSGMGRQLYQRGPEVMLGLLSNYLQDQIYKGQLIKGPSETMALHLKALYEAEHHDRCLFGVIDRVEQADIEAAASRAVNAFLNIYGGTGNDERGNRVKNDSPGILG